VKFEEFEILEFKLGEKAGFYCIKIDGEKEPEAIKFFTKFARKKRRSIENMLKNIDYMVNSRGCQEHLFKHEFGDIYKLWDGKLRLYCIRFGNCAAILGGGDIKKVRATQDSEILLKHFQLLKNINVEVNKRISKGEIIVTDNRLLERE
jgi:diaminopimelate epimerase